MANMLSEKCKPRLSLQDYVKSQVAYDESTGTWTWLCGPRAGTAAGLVMRCGHPRIVLGGVRYKCSVLAVLYMTGALPASGLEVDHINGDTNDNRWCNLRVVSHSINLRNQKMKSNNTSGHNGVNWYSPYGMWRVRVLGRHIGYYDDITEAITARDKAYSKNEFHENHGRKL